MLACNRLRVDSVDGSHVDYRIENGVIESRSVRVPHGSAPAIVREWHRLTPQELSSLIITNKVINHWLTRRMGIFALVRACSGNTLDADQDTSADSMKMAA
jgi:hypothetical protein